MAIATRAEPVGSLSEVRDAGLDREDLLGIYRNMLITRGVEERGHILYRQGKIPGSFYTGRGNEAAAVGVATAMGPDDVGTPLHRDMGVHITRGVEPWRIFAQYMGRADGPTQRPGRQRPHGRREPRADRDGQPPAGDAAGRRRLRARVPHPRGEARRASRWFGEGASARGDTHEGMNFAGVRQLPVVFICDNNQWAYSTPTHLEYATRAPRRPRAGVRLRGRRRRRHRRARRLPRGEARDREGARRRRPDADRVPDAAHGGPRRPRRRVLRPEGAVRGVGEARSDRALPHLAARERRADRRRGGRDRRRRQEAAERRAPARGGVAAARSRRRCSTASTRRPRTSTRRTTSRWPRRPICRRSPTASARRCAATSASS